MSCFQINPQKHCSNRSINTNYDVSYQISDPPTGLGGGIPSVGWVPGGGWHSPSSGYPHTTHSTHPLYPTHSWYSTYPWYPTNWLYRLIG